MGVGGARPPCPSSPPLHPLNAVTGSKNRPKRKIIKKKNIDR